MLALLIPAYTENARQGRQPKSVEVVEEVVLKSKPDKETGPRETRVAVFG